MYAAIRISHTSTDIGFNNPKYAWHFNSVKEMPLKESKLIVPMLQATHLRMSYSMIL